MHQDIENIIKKNLPDKIKKQSSADDSRYPIWIEGYNEAIDKIPVSLIADEVLKVVVEKIEKYEDTRTNRDALDTIKDILEILTLSYNKENKNNG